jgi:hypothetical protein
VVRPRGVPRGQLALDLHRGGDRVHHAAELREQVVADEIHHAAVITADDVGHQLAVRGRRPHGRRLVVAHEPAVPLDVGVEDRHQLAVHYFSPALRARSRPRSRSAGFLYTDDFA